MVKVCYTFFQLVALSPVVSGTEATRSSVGERTKQTGAAFELPAALFSNEGSIFG